ncbi:MAG: hypothetical protein J1F14_04620 [Treponema sp.]|nr:hypothetical protein [Treponema sp.]
MAVTQNSNLNTTLSPRIAELQKKIQDKNYVNNAIDRIAVIMSRHIVGTHSTTGNTADFLI